MADTLDDLLVTARSIWGDHRAGLHEVSDCVGVIAGDIHRQSRALRDVGQPDMAEVAKELGNAILSALRWIEDLGLDREACLAAAVEAQAAYARRLRGER